MATDGALSALSPQSESGRAPGAGPLACYDAESLAGCRRWAGAYCLTSAILLLAFAVLDRSRFPQTADVLLRVREVGALALALILGLVQTRFGARHPRAVGILAAATMGVIEQLLALAAQGILQGRAAGPALSAESPIILGTTFAMV